MKIADATSGSLGCLVPLFRTREAKTVYWGHDRGGLAFEKETKSSKITFFSNFRYLTDKKMKK